jgi:hypothetical protein
VFQVNKQFSKKMKMVYLVLPVFGTFCIINWKGMCKHTNIHIHNMHTKVNVLLAIGTIFINFPNKWCSEAIITNMQ